MTVLATLQLDEICSRCGKPSKLNVKLEMVSYDSAELAAVIEEAIILQRVRGCCQGATA